MGHPSTDARAITDEDIVAEIQTIFQSMPLVFERMREAGELQQHWPGIKAVLVEPEPLTPAIVQALFRIYSMHCSAHYCFVLHSLTLSSILGWPEPERVSHDDLLQVFELPQSQPDHERWGRALRLAWLAQLEGPQQEAADYLLRETCSEAEYDQVIAVYHANHAINSFTVEPPLPLDNEPMIDTFPEEIQALVPEFVQFFMREHNANNLRPVSSMCSICREVRSKDEKWYPYAVASELLADNVLFSHGLCPSCLADEGVPQELW